MQETLRAYVQSILPETFPRFFEDYSKLLTIRANSLKISIPDLEERLGCQGYHLDRLPVSGAYSVAAGEAPISKSLDHFLGLLYIQSVASMIPPMVLDPKPDDAVLDLCAAPGSKTTQMAQMMDNRGRLVANEYDGKRIKTLSHNLDRMGVVNAALVNMAGERIGNLIPETFDKVLVDAPCSALGVIHKAPEAVRNIPKILQYAYRQEQLITSAIKAAKVGGTIVYSTCTIAPEENEMVINNLLKKYPVEIIPFELPDGIDAVPALHSFNGQTFDESLADARRLIPNAINPEGFFIAKLTKRETVPGPDKEPFSNNKIRFDLNDASRAEIRNMSAYFEKTFGIPSSYWDNFSYFVKPDEILLASAEWKNESSFLDRIYTHRVGTRLARMRRENEWKLSTNCAQLVHGEITKNRVALANVSELQTFAEAGTIRRSFDIEKGGVVAFYDGQPIGCGVIHNGQLKSQMPKSRKVTGVEF